MSDEIEKERIDVFNLKPGTVLKKGNRKRIFVNVDGFYVYYKLPSKPKSIIGEHATIFLEWSKGAEIEKESDE